MYVELCMMCMVIKFNIVWINCKVANPARGQLDRENEYSPVPVRAGDFGLARRVQPSRPAQTCSFSILRLNLMLTSAVPPDFRGGVQLFM